MKFLQYDSPFMTRFRMVVDYFLLGILWIVACVPLVTFGAATTAMLMTAEYNVRQDEANMFRTFWKYFGKEFKQSTLLWLIQIPILAALVFYAVLVYKSEFLLFLKIISYVIMGLVFAWLQLWLAYESKFEDRIKTVILNSLRITLANLGPSALMVLCTAVFALGVCLSMVYFQPALLVLPAVYIVIYTLILRKLFRKLLPPEEEPVEEIEE